MDVELQIYSGQPNPAWTLTPGEAAELEARLAGLPLRPGLQAFDEPLGYRGLRLHAMPGGASLTVAAGVVERRAPDGSLQQLVDAHRQTEAWLLTTAAGRLDEALRQFAISHLGTAHG